jgi:DNA (cytosine-5)-methyltransferase 1
VAWEPLGWKAAWFSEIEPFPCSVLAHRYPDVPNLGDMTRIHENETFKKEEIDVLVGGTPCQSFSSAGLRRGLDDPRGRLILTFVEIAREKRPRWVVWENVSDVLSSGGGRVFGSFLGSLVKCGYSLAYRVLDAQHYGVAQRRKRVFVVGHLDGAGDGHLAERVLFDAGTGAWNAPPRRKKGSEYGDFPAFACRPEAFGWESTSGVVARCLTTKGGKASGRPNQVTYLINGDELDEIEGIRDGTILVDYADHGTDDLGGEPPPLVRQLLTIECERLQGFDDDYTLVPYRGKPASDGLRFHALGNSIAVPVLRWLGRRIAAIDGLPCTNVVQPPDPETVAKALSDSELVEKCVQGFRDLREALPYLMEARLRFAQPGRRVPVPGNPTWTEWVQTNLHVTVRRVQQLLKEPSEAISLGAKTKRRAGKLRSEDWRGLLKVTQRSSAQVFGSLERRKLAGAIRNFAQGIADQYARPGGKLVVSVSVETRK